VGADSPDFAAVDRIPRSVEFWTFGSHIAYHSLVRANITLISQCVTIDKEDTSDFGPSSESDES
jgi:hypothetical protein